MKEIKSNFLTPDENLLQGMASVLDIAGSLSIYNSSETGEEADAKAIANDWAMIGKDIATEIDKIAVKSEK